MTAVVFIVIRIFWPPLTSITTLSKPSSVSCDTAPISSASLTSVMLNSVSTPRV